MKKYARIIREYPVSAALCFIADIAVTAAFTCISRRSDPSEVTYFIALYGTLLGILIFSHGCVKAKERAARKAAERLRKKRRREIISAYAKEFYGITEKSS